MNKLFEFSIPKEEEVTEKTPSKDDEGNEIVIEKKVKKTVDKKFFLQKPNRAMRDQANMYYNVQIAQAIKAGMLTNHLLESYYKSNDEQFKTSEIDKKLEQLYTDRENLQREVEKASKKSDGDDKNSEIIILTSKVITLNREIRQLEINKLSLYDNTAESFARTRLGLWYAVHIAYNDDGTLVFGGDDLDKKLNRLDSMEEAGGFEKKLKDHILYSISLWLYAGIESQIDYDNLIKSAPLEELDNEEEPAAVEKPAKKPRKKRKSSKTVEDKTETETEIPSKE